MNNNNNNNNSNNNINNDNVNNINNIIINNINNNENSNIYNNNNNNDNKGNLIKINILKKGILDERKKNTDLTNELIKLKEENVNYKEKNTKLKSKIEKLSKEINEYKNNNNNNNSSYVGKFFTNFFEDNNNNSENEEEENSNDSNNISNANTNILINSLQNQISSLSNEKKILSNKLEETNEKFKIIKEDYETLLTNLKNDFSIKEKKYLDEISEKTKRINSLTEFIKNFENEKKSYENSITKKNETLKEIVKQQEKFFIDLDNKNFLIKNLNYQIDEYKKIIEQLTPINNTLDFEAYKILNKNDKIKVIFNFSKNKNKITYKEQNKKEIIFTTKELINMNQDKNNKNIIYMEFYLNKIKYVFQYLFQNERICEYILKYYKEIKKPGMIQNTLFNLSLNDYFY